MQRLFKGTLLFILIAILLSLAGLSFLIFAKQYDEFINWLLVAMHKDNAWKVFLQKRFSPLAFTALKWIVVIFDIAFFFLIMVFFKRYNKIENRILIFIDDVRQDISACINTIKYAGKTEKFLFAAIIGFAFIKTIYYDLTVPIKYDEAWTYNYFIHNGLWQSVAMPSNNHKLFTFTAWFFNLLPFDKTFLIRLPCVLGGIVMLWVFYCYLRKKYTLPVALIGLTWLATCLPVAKHMFIARSYIFVILFSLLFIITCFRIFYSSPKKYLFVSAAIFIAAGYFSNPVFFFCHVSISIFLLVLLLWNKQTKKSVQFIYLNFAALILVAVMYAPDIIGGHFSALLEAAVKQNTAENYAITCIDYNASFQTGIENSRWLFAIIIVAGIVSTFKTKGFQKTILWYSVLSILWLPAYASFVHDDTALHKTIFITLSFTFILVAIISSFVPKKIIQHPAAKFFLIALIIIEHNKC